MASNPRAVAKALIQASKTQGPGGFGSIPAVGGPSPLVASYGEWAGGRAAAATLPRDVATFLAGSFGPLTPMRPMPVDPPDPDTDRTDPRRWQYPVGWNLPHGVPGDEGLKLASFAQLRTIADTYSVARACIQLRKTELLGLGWDITPTKEAEKAMRGDRTARRDFDERRAKLMAFWRRPDQNYFRFRDWFAVVLEEILVTDALSLYQWPTRRAGKGVLGTDLGQLASIDGSTIRPLLDTHGATPLPPYPGYQQYLYGVPRTDLVTLAAGTDLAGIGEAKVRDYRADQLINRPQNPRNWTVYGFPPIEQALMPIMSGIQRQQYQLEYFAQGTVPGLFISAGDENATPNQLRELQDALNAMAGDPSWKHKIIVLPQGSKADPQRATELAGAFDELVMSQVCMAFSVQPMELGITPRSSTTQSSGGAHNQMAKSSKDTHDRKANLPMLEWCADIFNFVIQDVCGQHDMRWWWEGSEDEDDEAAKTTTQVQRVSTGLSSVDEVRIENGHQPWGLKTTSEPILITGTGIIPFDAPPPPPPGEPPGGPDQPPPPGGRTPPKPAPAGPAGTSRGQESAQQAAGTPAHAGARQHQATTKPATTKPATTKPATTATKAEQPVAMHAALRELDLIRRRLAKGRTLDGWTPEHLPGDVFTTLTADLVKVGPKGYIHGWIFVGPQAAGTRVVHPHHGSGTVTRSGPTTHVRFDTGAEHSFATGRPTTGAHFTGRPAPAAGRPRVTSPSGKLQTSLTPDERRTLSTEVKASKRRLTPGQVKAVEQWTSGKGMVRRIQTGKVSADTASNFDAAMRDAPKVPGLVYRGVANGSRGEATVAGLRVGSTLHLGEPVSTSIEPRQSAGFGPYLFEIHTPAAAYIAGMGSRFTYEKEAVLPPGTFQVVSIEDGTIGLGKHTANIRIIRLVDTTGGDRSWLPTSGSDFST